MIFATSNANITNEFVKSNQDISVTDSNDLFDVYYYNNCDDSSPEELKNVRGVVFTKEGDLVMRSFGYTPEYSTDNLVQIPNFQKCICFESQEGALIRLFCHESKWYVATHRKLDAYHSKWSSKYSFGEMFENAIRHLHGTNSTIHDWIGEVEHSEDIINKFFTKLNPAHQYMFLIRNSEENRIVCINPDTPTVYYAGSFWNQGNTFGFDDIPIEKPRQLEFNSIDELKNFVDNCEYTAIQGVIVFTPENRIFKVLNSTYLEYYNIRDNCPSVKFRYLQLRNDPRKVEQLKILYPKYIPDFEKYENIIETLAKQIHQSYIARFVNKHYSKISSDLYMVTRICHGMHIANRNVKVTLDLVKEILNRQSDVYLNRVIKEYLFEQKRISTTDTSVEAVAVEQLDE